MKASSHFFPTQCVHHNSDFLIIQKNDQRQQKQKGLRKHESLLKVFLPHHHPKLGDQ